MKRKYKWKNLLKLRFQGLTKNLIHFFICVRLFDLQSVGMKFRTEEACVNRSFVRFRMTWVEVKNINEKEDSRLSSSNTNHIFR